MVVVVPLLFLLLVPVAIAFVRVAQHSKQRQDRQAAAAYAGTVNKRYRSDT